MNLIRNVRVISPDIDYKYANIILDGEYIKSVTEKEVNPENFDRIIEGEGLTAFPGFIDEHTHGAVGYDVCDGKYESIDKIAEASCAGVRVDMIIRGISCLKPGVPGKTENVHVRSIVGRFLEHARVYAFGVDSDMIYLSSADMMTRNTEHRVEIAFPVLDPTCRALVHEYMGMQLRDNVKARSLTSDGTWVPVERAEGEKPFNSQEALLERAYRNAEAAAQQRAQEKERVAEEAIQAEVEHRAVAKPETVAAPVKEGEKVGTVTFKNGETVLGTADVVAAESVEKIGFLTLLPRILRWMLCSPEI